MAYDAEKILQFLQALSIYEDAPIKVREIIERISGRPTPERKLIEIQYFNGNSIETLQYILWNILDKTNLKLSINLSNLKHQAALVLLPPQKLKILLKNPLKNLHFYFL